MELALEPTAALDRSLPPDEGDEMAKATGDQVRAARALIRMEARKLAELADVSTATLRRFEGGANIHRKALRDVIAALEAQGLEFIDRGVRLKEE
jgi:DNA-binding transcriptional regulator YiaG